MKRALPLTVLGAVRDFLARHAASGDMLPLNSAIAGELEISESSLQRCIRALVASGEFQVLPHPWISRARVARKGARQLEVWTCERQTRQI